MNFLNKIGLFVRLHPAFFRTSILIVSPLLFAFDLVLKFQLDEAQYCAFVECNLLTIYAGFFLAALFATIIKPSDK
jgi:hypothetical protein